ncbi:MAG: hypothetical protein ABSE07_12430 [Methanoregula sp.]|jgi:MFS family permease
MFGKTSIGEWVVLVLSLIIALVTTFSRPLYETGFYIAGYFIGAFILSVIVLYIIYWIIKKVYPKSEYWGIILWILAIIGIPVIIVIVFAIIAAFVFGMSGNISQTSLVQTTEISRPPAPVYATMVTIAPPVQAIPRPYIQGWNEYTIPQTQIGIYTPQDWITTTKDMSYGGKQYTVLSSLSPDLTTAIGAFSMDVTGILMGPEAMEKELNQGYIDSDTYQSLITGLTSTSTSTPVINIIQDPNYYSMSGHPARKIEYDQGNGHAEDYLIIHDKNTVVLEMMMTTTQATYNDRTEGEESLKSITG